MERTAPRFRSGTLPMKSNSRPKRQRWHGVFLQVVLGAAIAIAVAACSGTAPPTATNALTPTLVPAATLSTPVPTAQATLPAPTATATPQPPAIATTSTPAATALAVPQGASSQAAVTPAGATPDRPFGPRTKDAGCAVHDGLPDYACTPGAIFPDVTGAQVCQRGYSSSVRNVPAEVSREVYREYGIVERTTGEYEVDHLTPLEAGGSNDIANL
jgi:hypothetical protein